MGGVNAATLTQALWRRRYLLIAVASIFLLAGEIAVLLTPRSYRADATLFLDTERTSQNFDIALQAGQLLQHDFIVLATKRPVLLEACATPGAECTASEMASPDTELQKRVDVNYVNGSSMLAVTAKASNGQDAAGLANAVARAMVHQYQAEVDRLLKPTEDALDAQLTQLQTGISKEQKALAGSRPADAAAHQAQLTFLTSQYATANTHRQDLRDLHDRLAGIPTVLQTAAVPLKASEPDPLRYLLAALLIGLAAGVLMALLRQRFDDRIYSVDALAAAAGTPTVVTIPRAPRKAVNGLTPYSLAHARLVARHPEARKILMAAASSRDRSDEPAYRLGSVAARAGQRVLVFQTDMAPEASATGFIPNGDASGLTSVTVTSNNDSKAAALALVQADGHYDLTILAAPAPESSPYTLSAARLVEHTVLVATAGVTHVAEARRTAELLREAGGTVTASLLLPRQRRRGRG
jgi:capsular polysaccharide biosynthesis protein